jgi:hypothetical protein
MTRHYRPRNRLADPQTRDDEPQRQRPSPVPVEMAPPSDVPPVVRCPACGVARIGNWRHQCSTRGEPRKECRACGAVWAIGVEGGTMRRVR